MGHISKADRFARWTKLSTTSLVVAIGLMAAAASPAAMAYEERTGGGVNCAHYVNIWSATTYSIYHRANGLPINHWVDGGAYTFHASNTGFPSINDWAVYTPNGSISYGYPKCN